MWRHTNAGKHNNSHPIIPFCRFYFSVHFHLCRKYHNLLRHFYLLFQCIETVIQTYWLVVGLLSVSPVQKLYLLQLQSKGQLLLYTLLRHWPENSLRSSCILRDLYRLWVPLHLTKTLKSFNQNWGTYWIFTQLSHFVWNISQGPFCFPLHDQCLAMGLSRFSGPIPEMLP